MEFRGGAEGEATNTHTNLDSDVFKKLEEATKKVMGESKPYSITGCLPLVAIDDLQEAEFDLQVGHRIQRFASSTST